MAVDAYVAEAVLQPLGLRRTELRGSVAKDAWSTVDDLALFAAELLHPTLVAEPTLAEATAEQFRGSTASSRGSAATTRTRGGSVSS